MTKPPRSCRSRRSESGVKTDEHNEGSLDAQVERRPSRFARARHGYPTRLWKSSVVIAVLKMRLSNRRRGLLAVVVVGR